jgi:hypothetical protein
MQKITRKDDHVSESDFHAFFLLSRLVLFFESRRSLRQRLPSLKYTRLVFPPKQLRRFMPGCVVATVHGLVTAPAGVFVTARKKKMILTNRIVARVMSGAVMRGTWQKEALDLAAHLAQATPEQQKQKKEALVLAAIWMQKKEPKDLAAHLAQATPEQQRQMLGERLFMLIVPTQSTNLAGKITGMLLEDLDWTELLFLIESPLALHVKINLALDALGKHSKP